MAVLHPADIENYNYSGSEKVIYEEFGEQLPERDHVFYSVRWFEKSDNVRIDSESDFLVFDPTFGFLAIEVKGGIGLEVSPDNKDWTIVEKVDGQIDRRQLHCSPYEQAEKSMRHFYNYFHDEFNQSFRGAYGFAVALPFYSCESIVSDQNPRELTIDHDDMGNLAQKINSIFHYWKNKRNNVIPFSTAQKQKFLSLVNKRISLSAAAGALIDIKEKQFSTINAIQNGILDALYYYKSLQFIGGAGTGKTVLAAKKAEMDAKARKKVLVTCSSPKLAAYFQNTLLKNSSNITCESFDQLVTRLLGQETYQKVSGGDGYFSDYIADIAEAEKYDSVIVDEAQDFTEDMGLALSGLLKSDYTTFYVFYDESQNIYSRNFGKAFEFSNPPIILKYNVRNTGRIYEYAIETSHLGNQTIANNLLGVEPDTSSFTSPNQARQRVENIILRLVDKECVTLESVVVLSNVSYEDSILGNVTKLGGFDIDHSENVENNDKSKIRFFQVENFKGMEANVIIYIEDRRCGQELDQELKYVALTRARYFMYIVSIGK